MPNKGLPQFTGRGFLISKGVELKYTGGGLAYARLPLAFSHRVKVENSDEWETKNEVLVQAVAFGALAEYIADAVPEGAHAEIDVVGELYYEEWEKDDGEIVPQVKATLSAAGVVPPRTNSSSGGGSGRRVKSSSKSKPKQEDPWADVPNSSEPPRDDPWGDDEPPF